MDVKFESWKDIIKDENIVFKKTKVLTDNVLSYCPGCGHGVAHRLIAETIEEMGIQDQTIGIAPVGCSVLAYEFFDIDMQQAAHGRATALATAIKRLYPNKFVFTYQGDGDLAAIGGNETMHACNSCLLYTSDAADDLLCVDLGGRRIIKKKTYYYINSTTSMSSTL